MFPPWVVKARKMLSNWAVLLGYATVPPMLAGQLLWRRQFWQSFQFKYRRNHTAPILWEGVISKSSIFRNFLANAHINRRVECLLGRESLRWHPSLTSICRRGVWNAQVLSHSCPVHCGMSNYETTGGGCTWSSSGISIHKRRRLRKKGKQNRSNGKSDLHDVQKGWLERTVKGSQEQPSKGAKPQLIANIYSYFVVRVSVRQISKLPPPEACSRTPLMIPRREPHGNKWGRGGPPLDTLYCIDTLGIRPRARVNFSQTPLCQDYEVLRTSLRNDKIM